MSDVNHYPEQASRAAVAMNYRQMAARLEAQAVDERMKGYVLHSLVTEHAAKVARRAADAEMTDREP